MTEKTRVVAAAGPATEKGQPPNNAANNPTMTELHSATIRPRPLYP